MKFAARLLIKLYQVTREKFWTAIQIIPLRIFWSIGSGTIFEGLLVVRSTIGSAVIGNGVRFGAYVNIAVTEHGLLDIGDDVSINQGAYLICRNSIRIGKNTRIGEYSSIRDNSHCWRDRGRPINMQGFDSKPIFIGEDVWLGRCVTIMPGISIGDGAIVGAGSVVTKNIAPFEIFAGVPAKKIGSR